MKYEFQGSFIVATAESIQDNAILISTQGAVQPQPEDNKKKKQHKENKKIIKQYSNKGFPISRYKELKEKIDSIPKGQSVFIPDELAKISSKFVSYTFFRAKRRGVKASTYKVDGGYQVAIK